eukprot:1148013-Pelagomonas_calceolata.AAC.2
MQPEFTTARGFNIYLWISGVHVKERAESATGRDRSSLPCLALNSSNRCWSFGQACAGWTSPCVSCIISCLCPSVQHPSSFMHFQWLKASFHEEWQDPLLNNHWGKMGVVLCFVEDEGSPSCSLNFVFYEVSSTEPKLTTTRGSVPSFCFQALIASGFTKPCFSGLERAEPTLGREFQKRYVYASQRPRALRKGP